MIVKRYHCVTSFVANMYVKCIVLTFTPDEEMTPDEELCLKHCKNYLSTTKLYFLKRIDLMH